MIFSIFGQAVLASSLAGMVAIGFFYAARQTATRKFFSGGQRFGPLAMSRSAPASLPALRSVHLHKSVALAVIKGRSLFMGVMPGAFRLGLFSRRAAAKSAFFGCNVSVVGTLDAGIATPLTISCPWNQS